MDTNPIQSTSVQPDAEQGQVNPQSPLDTEQSMTPQGFSGEDQLVSPEQRQEMLDMIANLKEIISSIQAVRFASEDNREQVRQNVLASVFKKLKRVGVNLEDQESVAAFIEKLKQSSPELASMFEEAMNALLGGEEMAPEAGMGEEAMGEEAMGEEAMGEEVMGEDIENNMNNVNPNEALQETPR